MHSELESNGTIRGSGSRPRKLPSLCGQLLGVRLVPTFSAVAASSGTPEEVKAASSVGRDSVGQMSAVVELAAEVQELRLAVCKLAGSIMWDRGAATLGKRNPERILEQTVDMPAPQIDEPFGKDGRKYLDEEDFKDLIKNRDQACQDPADSPHRRGGRCSSGEATTGPLRSYCAEYGGSPASAVRQQSSGCAFGPFAQAGDQARRAPADAVQRQDCRFACCDAATGPSNSDCGEDGRRPGRAVHRQSRGSTCDHADQPGDQARRNPTDTVGHFVEEILDIPSPRTQERVADAIVDVTVPQFREEIGEVTQFSPHAVQEKMDEIMQVISKLQRLTESTAEQPADVPRPAEVEKPFPERLEQRTGELLVEPVPVIQTDVADTLAWISRQPARGS